MTAAALVSKSSESKVLTFYLEWSATVTVVLSLTHTGVPGSLCLYIVWRYFSGLDGHKCWQLGYISFTLYFKPSAIWCWFTLIYSEGILEP